MDKKDFPLDQHLLNRFQFTIVGRELRNGRPTLVLDFQPKKNLSAHSLKDHFLNKAAGRVWLDEHDYALVQTNVHLTEGVNILGGVAGAVNHLSYYLDRDRTPDGLWFTKAVKWHLDARELLARKILDHQEEYFNLRKLN